MPGPRDALAQRLRRQAGWCSELGSPMYASLLEAAAQDLERGGPVADVLDPYAGEPGTSALALRFMAAVHRLVLEDELPELGAQYPSTGGDGDARVAWPLFRQALVDHKDAELRAWVTFLSDDQTALDPKVVEWSKKHSVRRVPLSVFEDVVGPPSYLIGRDADVTVLLSVKQKVVHNFAFRAGELNDERIAAILNAVPEIAKPPKK